MLSIPGWLAANLVTLKDLSACVVLLPPAKRTPLSFITKCQVCPATGVWTSRSDSIRPESCLSVSFQVLETLHDPVLITAAGAVGAASAAGAAPTNAAATITAAVKPKMIFVMTSPLGLGFLWTHRPYE